MSDRWPGFRLCGALLVLLCLSSLTGCASRQALSGADVAWSQRGPDLINLPVWRAEGRIAVKSGGDGGQGNIVWEQASAHARISLRGPFGAGAYEIAWDDGSVVVTGKSGAATMAYGGPDAAERFIDDQLGWTFPARSTRYWILGVADPQFDSAEHYDDDGWLASIEQNGWEISYSRFRQVEAQWLPGKIVIENERARVKLVVDRWTL